MTIESLFDVFPIFFKFLHFWPLTWCHPFISYSDYNNSLKSFRPLCNPNQSQFEKENRNVISTNNSGKKNNHTKAFVSMCDGFSFIPQSHFVIFQIENKHVYLKSHPTLS